MRSIHVDARVRGAREEKLPQLLVNSEMMTVDLVEPVSDLRLITTATTGPTPEAIDPVEPEVKRSLFVLWHL